VCALIAVAAASAKSDAVAKKDKEPVAKHGGHILWTPQLKQQFGLRKQAMKDKLAGKASGKVHKVRGKFVEMSLERTDKIFVILTEFGKHAASDVSRPHPGQPADTGRRRLQRPLHNAIPAPNRANRQLDPVAGRLQPGPHTRNMYFNRMRAVLTHDYRVVRSVRDRRRGHGVGEGAVQRGALRAQPLRRDHLHQRPSS
jgi:hypothetical protein